MYDQFFGLDYDPFRLTPSGRDIFVHPSFERAQAYLEYGLMRAEGFVVITGPPGSGKTTLIRELVLRLTEHTRWVHIETPRLEPDDLLRLVVKRLGIKPSSTDKATVLEGLRDGLDNHARGGGRTLVLIDEAQDLPVDSLEELRLLSNLNGGDKPLLQIVLLGQPQLRDLIRDPSLEQLHQRTVASCRLAALAEDESVEFIRFRLRRAGWKDDPTITTAVLQLLHSAAGGIPRRLNLLASRLLLHAFAEAQHHLTLDDAISILREMEDEAVGSWLGRVNELRRLELTETNASAATPRPRPAAESQTAGADPIEGSKDSGGEDQQTAGRSASGRKETADARSHRNDPDDLVISGPDDAPGRQQQERQPSTAAADRERRRGHRGASRLRSIVVIVSVLLACIGVAMVVLAATPMGEGVGDQIHDWVEAVTEASAYGDGATTTSSS